MLDLLYPLGAAAIVFGTYGICVLVGRLRRKHKRDEAKDTETSTRSHKYRNVAMESLEERHRMTGPQSIHDDFWRRGSDPDA